jgi:hypothetical protein
MQQVEDIFKGIACEIDDHVNQLERILAHYNPFNVLANIIVNNQFNFINQLKKDSETKSPVIQEYLALICLRSPTHLRIGEFTRAMELGRDLAEINELAEKIIMKHSLLHLSRYNTRNGDGSTSDLDRIAQWMSSEELMVRNPTFDSFHWDQVEALYQPYDDYFKQTLGFSVTEGIRICETIADYMTEGATEAVQDLKRNAQTMVNERQDTRSILSRGAPESTKHMGRPQD